MDVIVAADSAGEKQKAGWHANRWCFLSRCPAIAQPRHRSLNEPCHECPEAERSGQVDGNARASIDREAGPFFAEGQSPDQHRHVPKVDRVRAATDQAERPKNRMVLASKAGGDQPDGAQSKQR